MEHSNEFDTWRELLKYGADMSSQDMELKTPLHTFFNGAVSTVLLDRHDLIDELAPDRQGMTVVHYAAWSSRITPAHISYFIRAQPLIGNASDEQGRRLIHLASERGNIPLVEYLCNDSITSDISLPDATGRTPMHYAAKTKRVGTMDLLLSKGADMNLVYCQGRSVLHEAAARNNTAALERVFELLGNRIISLVDIADHQGLTPVMLARRHSATQAVQYLESHTTKLGKPSPMSIDEVTQRDTCRTVDPRPRGANLFLWPAYLLRSSLANVIFLLVVILSYCTLMKSTHLPPCWW